MLIPSVEFPMIVGLAHEVKAIANPLLGYLILDQSSQKLIHQTKAAHSKIEEILSMAQKAHATITDNEASQNLCDELLTKLRLASRELYVAAIAAEQAVDSSKSRDIQKSAQHLKEVLQQSHLLE
ncbi:MAG: hypothetical protein J7M17_05775 [Anaerolineae bacterium]|nr:hypothetical protein [Anaerolineae bacterium]